MKKALITFILLFSALSLYSSHQIGMLDDAKALEEGEKQLGFVFGYQHDYGFTGMSFDDYSSYRIRSFIPLPFNSGGLYEHTMETIFALIPSCNAGFMGRWGRSNSREFSFGFNLMSPTFYRFAFFGPGVNLYWGSKKTFVRMERFNAAYKFNWGVQYNAAPGGGVMIRNALMFGSNKQRINRNIGFYLQNELNFGMSISSLEFYNFYIGVVKAVITPGIEFNLSVNHPKGFTFVWSMFTCIETEIDMAALFFPVDTTYYDQQQTSVQDDPYYYYIPPQPNHMISSFRVGMKFAWQYRSKNKDKIDWRE